MSNKMNYGKKFNGHSWIGGPVGYDPKLDRATWKGGYNPTHFSKDHLKMMLSKGKVHGNSKAAKARVGKLPNGDPPKPKVKPRSEYEKEFSTMVAEVVTRLEHGLEELNMAPPLKSKEVLLVNRRQVIEAINRLKQSFYRQGQGTIGGNWCGASYGGKYK